MVHEEWKYSVPLHRPEPSLATSGRGPAGGARHILPEDGLLPVYTPYLAQLTCKLWGWTTDDVPENISLRPWTQPEFSYGKIKVFTSPLV